MDWDVGASRADDKIRLAPSGELDLRTAPLLGQALQDAEGKVAAGDASGIVLALGALSFMDSSGLAVVLEAIQRDVASGAASLSVDPGTGAAAKVIALVDLSDALPGPQGSR